MSLVNASIARSECNYLRNTAIAARRASCRAPRRVLGVVARFPQTRCPFLAGAL